MTTIELRYAVLQRLTETLRALRSTAGAWAPDQGETARELVEALSVAYAAALRAQAEAHPERLLEESA